MKKYWPQIDMDGIMNVWIMKPGNKSRGRGIVLLNKLEDVMAKMNPSTKSDTRYVIQKYIGNRYRYLIYFIINIFLNKSYLFVLYRTTIIDT